MFNIKQFVNRITDNRNDREGTGENSAAYVEHEEQHSAEGFLCPPCMKAFPSPEALEDHYNKTHGDEVSTPTYSTPDAAGVDVQLLRQEIQNLQFTLADEKANSAELKNEMIKIQADLNARDVDSMSLRSHEKEFEESKSMLTSEVTLLRQQLAESLEQISILRKEKEAINQNAGLSTTEKEELKKELASLQVQLAHRNSVDDAEVLRQELVSVQKTMNELALEKEKEIEILTNKLNDAQKPNGRDLEELKQRLDETLGELNGLKQTMHTNKTEQMNQLKSLSDEVSVKEARISELENMVQAGEKKGSLVQQECDTLKIECDRLREQHAELCSKIETGEGAKAALEGLQKENDVLKKNVDDVQSQNKELNRQLHDIQLQLEKSSSDQKLLKGSLDSKTEDLKKCQLLQTQLNSTIDEKEKIIQDVKVSHKKLNMQLEEAEAQIKTIQGTLKGKEDQVNKLGNLNKEMIEKEKLQEKKILVQSSQIEDLETKVKGLETSLKESEETVATRTSDLTLAQETIKDLQLSLTVCKNELTETKEKLEFKIKGLMAAVEEGEIAVEAKSKALRDMKEAMQEEMTNLRNKLSSLNNELEQAKAEVSASCDTINDLTEQRNDSDQKLQLLQLKIDEYNLEKLQLEQTCAKNEEEKSQLLEKLIAHEAEAKTLNSTIEEVSRRKDDAMAALQELGRENQSLQIEIAKIQGRKWADDSNVSNCSSCRKEFTLTFRKHHCRHCGQIFCSECSSKSASVPSSKKPVRVCDPCYTKLTTQ